VCDVYIARTREERPMAKGVSPETSIYIYTYIYPYPYILYTYIHIYYIHIYHIYTYTYIYEARAREERPRAKSVSPETSEEADGPKTAAEIRPPSSWPIGSN